MSLVIALKHKNRIILAADKQTSVGDYKIHNTTKIWEVEELPGAIMGSVGLARASQVIQYAGVIDKNVLSSPDSINTEFVVSSLAPTIAATLKGNGITVEAEAGSGCVTMSNAFIFAYRDRAWMILSDFSVTEIDEYLAIGSGSDVARGVLFATKGQSNPFARLVTCIDAATESTLYVDDGVDILSTGILASDKKFIEKFFEGIEVEQPSKPKKKKPKKKPVAKKPKEEVKDVGPLEK